MKSNEELLQDFAKELGRTVVNECIQAIEEGQSAKALMLLPCIEDPPTVQPSLLHSAARNGLVDVVIELISTYKFDVEGVDSIGWRPIHAAASRGHVEVLQLLIAAFDCSPSCETEGFGETPLMIASRKGHLDAVLFLTSTYQCDVNAGRQCDGKTALHLACAAEGYFDIVQHLVAACNADVNATDNRGCTPLFFCTGIEIVRYLVSTCDAKVSIESRSRTTPLHSACQAGTLDVVEYLIEAQHCDP